MFKDLEPELGNYYKEIEGELRKIFAEYGAQFTEGNRVDPQAVSTRAELLQLQRTRLEETINDLEDEGKDIQEKGFYGFLADELIFDYKTEIANIIKENMLFAARASKIYDDPDFLEQIETATKKIEALPEFQMIFDTTGSTDTNITLRIKRNIFENIFGTAEDMANAIKAGRSLMANTMRGKIATYVWLEKLYGPAKEGRNIPQWRKVDEYGKRVYGKNPGKWVQKGVKGEAYTERMKQFYNQIMAAELGAMNDKIPFWYLMQYGNANVKLSTDKGGLPYPGIIPMRIIERSEEQIAERLVEAQTKASKEGRTTESDSPYNRASREYNEVLNACVKQINANKASIARIDDLLTRMVDFGVRVRPEEWAIEEIQSIDESIHQELLEDLKVAQATEKVASRAELRISLYVNQIIAGQLPEGKRVYIGYASGQRKKLRTVELSREVSETIKKYSESTENIQDIAERNAKFCEEQLRKMNAIRSKK